MSVELFEREMSLYRFKEFDPRKYPHDEGQMLRDRE